MAKHRRSRSLARGKPPKTGLASPRLAIGVNPKSKPAVPERRQMLRRVRNGVLAIGALSATGWYVTAEVMAGIREADLDRIGNGTPTVVQIHDPGCPTCRRLQRQARAALKDFDDSDLQYVVANIRQDKGKRLADKHGVGHVTLLLFDAQGKRRDIISGLHSTDALRQHFTELLQR